MAKAALFTLLCAILPALLVYKTEAARPKTYKAQLYFQMALPEGQSVDLQAEKNLLLSDGLLLQVLKDLNLLPQPSKFRGLDLGPGMKARAFNSEIVESFRNSLRADLHADNAVIELSTLSEDPSFASKIIESVFDKFTIWRRPGQVAGFDAVAIGEDKDLQLKRNDFIQAQSAFLSAVSGQSEIEEKKTILIAEMEKLKLRYGPKHPVMIETQRQLDVLNLNNVAPSAQKQELQKRMQEKFAVLDLAIREAGLRRNNQDKAGTKILPLGDVNVVELSRHAGLKSLLAGLAGALLSILYFALRRKIRPVIYNAADLEDLFPVSVLKASGDEFKNLRQELKLRSEPKLIIVTSTLPEEGRGDFILSLARMAARSGEKVLLMDADLRNPDLHKILPPHNHRNLVDYLSGQSPLEDVILRGEEAGLHVIYGTAIPNTALDLISSEKMRNLLISLREAYDLVLVQAPVAPHGPDARVLANIGDQLLYIVKQGRIFKADLTAALASFREDVLKKLLFVLK